MSFESINRNDIECYMIGFVALEENANGWQWGVDENGAHGDFQFGRVELIDRGDDGMLMRGKTWPTQGEALDKGIDYLWAKRPDIVKIARNLAIEGAKYRSKQQKSSDE